MAKASANPSHDVDTDIDSDMAALDAIEQAYGGGPVTFVVGGRSFAIRQLEPTEYDRMILIERASYRRALVDPEIAPLKDIPETIDARMTRANRMGYLRATIDYERDAKKREIAEKELSQLIVEDAMSHSSAEELAQYEAVRLRDQWLLDTCLLDGETMEPIDRNTEPELLHPAVFDEMRKSAWDVVMSMQTVPKLEK